MSNLPDDINELIENSLGEKLDNFEVSVHGTNEKGEGFVGEILFLSLKHKISGKEDHLVVKIVLVSEVETTIDFLSSSYLNEIYFYTELWPALQAFQRKFPKVIPLDIVAHCYGDCREKGKEKIVLDNLKYKNYDVHPKTVPVSTELYTKTFELYGRYHALSFAYKHHEKDEFQRLAKPLANNWEGFLGLEMIKKEIHDDFFMMEEILRRNNENDVIRKIQPYIKNGVEIFRRSLHYEGPNSVIVHGDSWSNNMMLKYNDSKELEDIKLIDYQMATLGTPVYDLTYAFYSGADQETLKNWEHFLKIYYNSLSKSLKDYDLDVENIYPYEILKKEWKENIQFGFLMSLMIWGSKYLDIGDVSNLAVTGVETNMDLETWAYSNANYVQAILNLARHFSENDFFVTS
ncbi:uncharacterized protein LOC114325830 [Diabrotica virgifera virgifera]|uniref:CHK kinase-like domain-containing protein n=1 Tax=Diabrotica virgifera virgifera TaxID=50390 RepID=A0ABM5ICE8_DIAVI|nr:uncharacterized protein LOC114325830 [Diabrotica virgifera virgifera]